MGLVGVVVVDLIRAGVGRVAEVGGPVVGGAGTHGVVQSEAARGAADLGDEEEELVGGHGASSYTIFTNSSQVLINKSIQYQVRVCQRVGAGGAPGDPGHIGARLLFGQSVVTACREAMACS